MNTEIYSFSGKASAVIDDDANLFHWNGTHVGYIIDSAIFKINGRHIGWYENEVMYDKNGYEIGYTIQTCPVRPDDGLPKNISKKATVDKSAAEFPSGVPTFKDSPSRIELVEFLKNS